MSITDTENVGMSELTVAERAAVDAIKEAYDASKRYWHTKHETQKRLYRRYLNDDVKDRRPSGYSDERTGVFYRCVDVLHSVIADALMGQSPIGKIKSEGSEDFPAGEVIDRVHAHQQRATDILNTLDQAILHAVITCGVVMPGWDHHSEVYWRDVPKTITLADPQNVLQPMELKTGEVERKPYTVDISRLDGTLIEPWNVYPTAGATNPLDAHEIIFRVPVSRQSLKNMERSEYIKNVGKIPDDLFKSGPMPGEFIDDTPIYQARKEDYSGDVGTRGEFLWVDFCYMLFPFYKYEENVPPDQGMSDDEFECILIRPEGSDVVLKFELNELGAKQCVVMRYAGDTFFGFSALEIAERLIQLDEDMFNWTMDRAKREVYRLIVVGAGINQSQIANPRLDGIVTDDSSIATGGKPAIWTEPIQPHVMPNLQSQRKIVYQLIDEVTAVLDFVRGQVSDDNTDESATMTNQRMQFVSKRFKARLKYFERNGLWWWMQWQTILNCHFLEDADVSQLTGIQPADNPFQLITPTLPIQSYDFAFEGSVKAVDDPVKAQILKDVLKVAAALPPGIGADGRLKRPNLTRIFEEFLRHANVTDDIDEFFIDTTPEEVMAPQTLNGASPAGGTSLGAVTPGDLLSSLPKPGAGVRKEMQ